MEALVAPVNNITLDIEKYVANQVGATCLPFPGMDKSGAPVCEFYVRASCAKGASCPFRHVRGDKTVVCKHWLRGLCKKGDGCEFLHEYDMSKMPECYFYTRFNACHNKECPFLHIDPESKIRDCPWYDRGFCRHGPSCRHRHVRRVLCLNYLAGFCPAGAECNDAHPRFEIPVPPDADQRSAKKVVITCHYCGEVGHKVSHCAKIPAELKEQHMSGHGDFRSFQGYNQGGFRPHHFGGHGRLHQPRGDRHRDGGDKPQRNMEDVICYKCGDKGHFANRCSKGHLAFLSLQQNIQQQQKQ